MVAFTLVMFVLLGFVVGGLFLYKYYKENIDKDEEKENYIPTTQDNIPIDSIRQGIVRLKNASYCAVINLPSVNIELMELEEKQVILEQYRQILTSIDFPFQFLQQSRIVDVSDYLKSLERIQRQSDNNFIRNQLEFYRGYIIDLIKTRAVLTKKFYLVIPFDEELEKRKRARNSSSAFDLNINKRKARDEDESDVIKEEKQFETAQKVLAGRISLIVRSFSRFDIQPEQLNDEELTELFYTSYNKNRSVYQPLPKDSQSDFTSLYVKREE